MLCYFYFHITYVLCFTFFFAFIIFPLPSQHVAPGACVIKQITDVNYRIRYRIGNATKVEKFLLKISVIYGESMQENVVHSHMSVITDISP